MPLGLSSVVTRTGGLMEAAVDQEIVILNMATDHYVGLDEIGRRIWELLEGPRRVDDLCQQLSKEFDAGPDQIAADVLPYLAELEREKLVHIVDEQAA